MRSPYQTKIESFYKEENRMPTYSEMLRIFGFKSKNAVFKIVGKMVEAGLVEKDHLGRLVPTDSIAEVDGEYTMKYFKKSGAKAWLEPANKNYKPIYPKHSLNIIAVLKAVIRK